MSPLIIEDELLERGLLTFEDALESLDGATDTHATHRVKVPSAVAQWHPSASPELGIPHPPPGPHPLTGKDEDQD
jgi:hypothetical protein